MPTDYERLQEGLGAIYLTLNSVVIALALEKLFDRMVLVAPLPPGDMAGVLIWLQAAALLVAAFAMFIIASYTVLALRWDISVLDAAGPFAILLILAAAITAVGSGTGLVFFYIAASGQFFGGRVLAQILREAEAQPANRPVLDRVDLKATFVAGTVSWVAPLVTAVLLHIGVIGTVGAVVGAALLLASMLALVIIFAGSWWRAIRPLAQAAGDDEPTGTAAG